MTSTARPGAIVYGGYTQDQLNAQYDQATLVPDLGPYAAFWAERGEAARAAYDTRLDVAYGPGAKERLDIFLPKRERAPVVVYCHGGAWRALDKGAGHFMAPGFIDAGAAFLSLDFDLAPEVSLSTMIDQVRRAVAWAHANAAGFGGDADRLYVVGHSSGGHMAGTLVAGGWRRDYGLPEDAIKAGVLYSGLYDLVPVRLSARNAYLDLDDDQVERLSPIRNIPKDGPPLLVGWGDGELDEFRRQSRAFADAWAAAGNRVEAQEVANANHFDISNLFADPAGPILPKVRTLFGLD